MQLDTKLVANMATDWTPTERKLLDVLSDGMRHTKEELLLCLVDDMGDLSNVKFHVSNMRSRLVERGQDILCEYRYGTYYYRHVVLLRPASEE